LGACGRADHRRPVPAKLPAGDADELADMLMSRHVKASTLITSNCGLDDWAKLLGDVVIVAPLIDRLMHHGTCSSSTEKAGD
jgi:hypothetical protein